MLDESEKNNASEPVHMKLGSASGVFSGLLDIEGDTDVSKLIGRDSEIFIYADREGWWLQRLWWRFALQYLNRPWPQELILIGTTTEFKLNIREDGTETEAGFEVKRDAADQS